MDINEAIDGRRSTRAYAADAPDDETIRRLIHAAAKAPNASNEQPWTFTVVRDQALLDRVARAAKAYMLANLPPGPRAARHRASLSDSDLHVFYHAPALILISATSDRPWAVEDCALAAENLMLTAHGAGLGTCWIGFAQGYLNTPEGKDALRLPAAWVAVAPPSSGVRRPCRLPPPEGNRRSTGSARTAVTRGGRLQGSR